MRTVLSPREDIHFSHPIHPLPWRHSARALVSLKSTTMWLSIINNLFDINAPVNQTAKWGAHIAKSIPSTVYYMPRSLWIPDRMCSFSQTASTMMEEHNRFLFTKEPWMNVPIPTATFQILAGKGTKSGMKCSTSIWVWLSCVHKLLAIKCR